MKPTDKPSLLANTSLHDGEPGRNAAPFVEWIRLAQLPGMMSVTIRSMGKSIFAPLTCTPVADIEVIAHFMQRGGPNTQVEIDATANWLRQTSQPANIIEYSGDKLISIFGNDYAAQAVQFNTAEYSHLLVRDRMGSYIYRWPAADTTSRQIARNVPSVIGSGKPPLKLGPSGKATPDASLLQSARLLATSVLRLSGADVGTFAEQFAVQASRPIAAWLDGDGDTFRQAVCFPVGGLVRGDCILTMNGHPLCVLIELSSRQLICLRFLDASVPQFSLAAFLRNLGHFLERLQQGTTAWYGIEKTIGIMTHRRVLLLDIALEADPQQFWRDHFSKGKDILASQLFQGMPPLPYQGRKQAVEALIACQTNLYSTVLEKFLGGLETKILKALHGSKKTLTVSGYNTYLRGTAHAQRNRIQAAETVPLLGYLLCEKNPPCAHLRRMVDDGQPLWAALSDTINVPEETVRWLRGKTADDIGDAWLDRIPELLTSLSHLAPEKRPRTRDEWTAYTDFALALEQVHFRGRQLCWLQDLARIGWISARQKFEAMRAVPSDLNDINDLLHELFNAVGKELLPEAAVQLRYEGMSLSEWGRMEKAIEKQFLDISIVKQIRTSLRWHQLLLLPPDTEDTAVNTAENYQDFKRLDCWPAPIDQALDVGELTAHFLTTPAQLENEGQRMSHCVGTYSYACLFDGSNIVSFRQRDGRSVSTAELRLVSHGNRLGFEVRQHRARRDAVPSAEVAQALQILVDYLSTEAMQPRLAQMRADLRKRQALDELRHRCRTDLALKPQRQRALKTALKLHVGYDRFVAAARAALSGNKR